MTPPDTAPNPAGGAIVRASGRGPKRNKTITAVAMPRAGVTTLARIDASPAGGRRGKVAAKIAYVTREEAEACALAARRPALRTFIRYLWLTGARVSEALAFRPCDLDTNTNSVTIVTLKRAVLQRAVRMPEAFVSELLYRATVGPCRPEERLWAFGRVAAFRAVQRAMVKAGIESKRAHPHAFRHGCAINLIRQGISTDIVKRYLGHASILSTERYLQATALDVREAVDRIKR